ncbi:MAG: hypothetical protein KAR20_00120 [Candidatus Heimdallarchaeota archaeon]|nr:hypothetical protein [Candidatus Heimdallarchaeota archaeon]
MLSTAGRIPCAHKGEHSINQEAYPDENTPCLICSGDVQSVDGDSYICPFTSSIVNRSYAVFRKKVNMEYITDTEREFEAQQREKAKYYEGSVDNVVKRE